MIIVNPPTDVPGIDLVCRNPRHRAVEAAIRIARIPFRCQDHPDVDALDWMRSVWQQEQEEHGLGKALAFVLLLDGYRLPVHIYEPSDVDRIDACHGRVIDGASGILALAAEFSALMA